MRKALSFILILILLTLAGCGTASDPVPASYFESLYSGDIFPTSDNTNSLGSSSLWWNAIYVDTIYTSSNISSGNMSVHALGGVWHSSSNLSALNALISDATLDDSSATRDPNAHKASHEDGGGDEISVTGLSGLLADDQHVLDAEVLLAMADVLTGYATVSEANRSIYVDKEATGSANGTSWADAFTTIQAAVNDMEDVVIHAHTIYVRDGTKKTGTADENTLNHLVDDASSQFVADDVGKRVFNVTDGTWGVVTAFVDAGDLTLAADTFPAGTEDYVIEASPYRETVHFNDAPTTYPAHLVLGSITIEGEYYFYGDCEANANAGEIKDTRDWTGVEVGDRVVVIDLNGVSGAGQDFELGTVDDISQIGANIVRTTLTKTPTTNWKYTVVKTEISGSDDGTNTGTARSRIAEVLSCHNLTFNGFYATFSDSYVMRFWNSRYCNVNGMIFEGNDLGIHSYRQSEVEVTYGYLDSTVYYTGRADDDSMLRAYYVAFECTGGSYIIRVASLSFGFFRNCYFANAGTAIYCTEGGSTVVWDIGIKNDVTNGLVASYNAVIRKITITNNATVPETPAGSAEGAYIG